MGWLTDLFGSGAVSSTSTSTNLPSWYDNYLQQVTAAGTNRFLNAAYPGQYTGQRVAGNNADINTANQSVRSGMGAYQPNIAAGTAAASSVANGFDQNAFNQYMNPYTNDVVNRIATLGQRNLTENILPQVNANFIGSGNWGSGQNQDFMGRVVRDTNESILGAQSQALQSGFQNQMQNYSTGQGQKLQGAGILAQLGQTGQTMDLKDAAALQQIGMDQRAQEQAGLDVGYGNYLEGRDWGRSMAQGAAQIGSGINAPATTTSTTSTNQGLGNSIGKAVGLGTSLASLIPQSAWSSVGSWLGFRHGGKVPRKPPGALKAMRHMAGPVPMRNGVLRGMR